jgi:hypothetical protein
LLGRIQPVAVAHNDENSLAWNDSFDSSQSLLQHRTRPGDSAKLLQPSSAAQLSEETTDPSSLSCGQDNAPEVFIALSHEVSFE